MHKLDYFAVEVRDEAVAPGYPLGSVLICKKTGPGTRFKPGDRVVIHRKHVKPVAGDAGPSIPLEITAAVLPAEQVSGIDILGVVGKIVAVYPPTAEPGHDAAPRRRRRDRMEADILDEARKKALALGMIFTNDVEFSEDESMGAFLVP